FTTTIPCRQAGNRRKLGKFAARLDPGSMHGIGRPRRQTFFAVLDASTQFAGDVLVESATQANVEALAAIANGEDRFARSERAFKDREISLLSVGIGVMGLFVARTAVQRWL